MHVGQAGGTRRRERGRMLRMIGVVAMHLGESRRISSRQGAVPGQDEQGFCPLMNRSAADSALNVFPRILFQIRWHIPFRIVRVRFDEQAQGRVAMTSGDHGSVYPKAAT